MKIYRFSNESECMDAASAQIDSLLEKSQKAFQNTKKNTLMLLSGGSSLKLLNRLSGIYFGEYITMTTLDERFSTESSVNNFLQFQETYLYDDARSAGTVFLDTSIRNTESLEDASNRINEKITKWKDDNPDGRVIATIGIGLNGHVAGIMPYPEDENKFNELFNKKGVWVIGYDSGDKDKYPKRITSTLPFIRQIDNAVVFVCGNEKKETLQRVLDDKGALHETPARIIKELDNVSLYTDIKE